MARYIDKLWLVVLLALALGLVVACSSGLPISGSTNSDDASSTPGGPESVPDAMSGG